MSSVTQHETFTAVCLLAVSSSTPIIDSRYCQRSFIEWLGKSSTLDRNEKLNLNVTFVRSSRMMAFFKFLVNIRELLVL